MTTSARIGYGARFQNGDGGSPEAFTDLVGIEITNITPPQPTRDSIDASHELSPDSYREFIPGLVDAGEVSIEFNFVPDAAGFATMLTELATAGSSAVKNRRIVFPDGSYFQFSAFLTGVSPETPLDDKMSATATFKVTGKPELTQV